MESVRRDKRDNRNYLISHSHAVARRRVKISAPVPNAIFFCYGFAINRTNDLAQLGGPASHGCVRLHPSHAGALFAAVQRNGPRNTHIEINQSRVAASAF